MKRFIIQATFITALFTSCGVIFGTDIYIENHYGAPIKFKKGKADSTAPEVSIAHLARALVGPYLTTTDISIRTTGTGSRFLSYFTELTPQLNQIGLERANNQGKDAVIIIKPSRSYQNWDIEIHWEKSGQKIEALSDAEAELIDIMNGSLGQDYAQKARAINDYDYTKATKKGLQNLRTHLLKRIEETIVQTYKKYVGREQMEAAGKTRIKWQAPDLSTTEDLKNNIDMLYRSLQRYKAAGN